MTELDDFDSPFEAFDAAQAGAVAHLETMGQTARDAAEDVLLGTAPITGEMRAHAQRLTQAAEQCDALGVLISLLDLPPAEDGL